MSADRRFRLLIASYTALLLGPLPTVLVSRDPPFPALSWLVLLVGFAVAGTLGYATAERVALRTHLSNVLGGSLLALLPLCYLGWLFALIANNPGKTAAHLFARPENAGILAFLPAMVAIHESLAALGADAAPLLVEFTARPAPGIRRIRLASMAGGLGLVVGIGISLYLNGQTSPFVLAVLALAVVAILLVVFQTFERTIRLREDGIEIDGTLTAWSAIDAFEVDDDRLVVRLRSRWTDDVRLDRSDITDVERVETTLAERVTEQSA